MQFNGPWAFVLCTATVLIPLGAAAGKINAKAWVSEPLICAAVGILLGPVGFGVLRLDVGISHPATDLMREAARLTLAIAVTGAALRLPKGWLRRNWAGLAVVLGPGMLAMCGLGTLCAWLCLGLSPLYSLLIGAAVTPTDPVIASPVVSGKLAQDNIPEPLRNAITAESAANDGLALPLVMLPAALAHGASLEQWAVHVVLWQVGGALVLGVIAGWLASRCLKIFGDYGNDTPASILSVALALAIATVAAGRLLDVDGILAAFVAGVILDSGLHGEVEERQHWFNEAIGRFFDLPVIVLFGAALPWGTWVTLGWRALAFTAAVLLLRRLPAWVVLHRLLPWTRGLSEAVFSGWFGPIGVSALFYATDLQDKASGTMLWPIISLAAAGSILVHGVTSTPFTTLLGRRLARVMDRPAAGRGTTRDI